MLLALALALPGPARADVSALLAYEEAYDNVADGDWYIGSDNSGATLAWGQSYVMMSLVEMLRATGDLRYLDRLHTHVEAVLDQRDDTRGVADYRGVSAACWQNTSYQPEDQPYCYVVHSGMLALPMVDAALLIDDGDWGEGTAPDGRSWAEVADAWIAAAEQVVAAHEDQWDDTGFYRFRDDADFLSYPGVDLPLNQSNALGRLLVSLHQATGDGTHGDKAEALAARFADQLTQDGDALLWNYWGGAYASPGEDISHAAINVDFAARCAEAGIVFDDEDVAAFAETFVARVYAGDASMADNVGGVEDGAGTDGSSYEVQAARWLRVAERRATVWTAVRDLYDAQVDPTTVASGSMLLGLGMLAARAPQSCFTHFFYAVDWSDPVSGWRQATAYGANILVTPLDWAVPCVVELDVELSHPTTVQIWDEVEYHDVGRWSPTGGEATRWLPYEPIWSHDYWKGGQLYQFADDFVEGEGIRVGQVGSGVVPSIDSEPPTTAEAGELVVYAPSFTGNGPAWWSLSTAPTDARVDALTGQISWEAHSGEARFTLVLDTDDGQDVQAWTITVPQVEEPDSGDGGADDPVLDGESEVHEGAGGAASPVDGSCSCSGGSAAGAVWLAGLVALVRRRRPGDVPPG